MIYRRFFFQKLRISVVDLRVCEELFCFTGLFFLFILWLLWG